MGGLLLSAWLAASGARAQAGCDEGVIRLPDRNGTVQICSALAAQVPQLARQLTEATRALGDQRAQIRELTRLVRGLNGVSQSIGTDRQAAMLRSLSAELGRSQRGGGDAQLRKLVENLSEQLDALREQMLGALAAQAAAPTAAAPIHAEVADAIARLDFAGATRQLEEITVRLKALQSQVGEVRSDTQAIRQKLDTIEERELAGRRAEQEQERRAAEMLKRFQEGPDRLLSANVYLLQHWVPGMDRSIPALKYALITANKDVEWKDARLVLSFKERGKGGTHVDATPLLDGRRVGTGQEMTVRFPANASDLGVCVTLFDPQRQRRVTWWQEFGVDAVQSSGFQIAAPLRPAQVLLEDGEQKCAGAGSRRENLQGLLLQQR